MSGPLEHAEDCPLTVWTHAPSGWSVEEFKGKFHIRFTPDRITVIGSATEEIARDILLRMWEGKKRGES